MMVVIGAGLAGLSCSYHLGHDRCLVLEKDARSFGHIGNEQSAGFTWDQGPHVSFTKHAYVQSLFADSVDGDYSELEVCVSNYYHGHWISHPAQTSLYQVPEPLRTRCVESFLAMRQNENQADVVPKNYLEWLEISLGKEFANNFPALYTRKYWTVDASELATEWVGYRMHKPSVQEVINGSQAPLGRSTHYIQKVRYPKQGGYQSFAKKIAQGSHVRYGCEIISIDLERKCLSLATGESIYYTALVNTMPLPKFVAACKDVPPEVREAAQALSCSQLILVNVSAPHATLRPEHWMYVYDEDKLVSRINCTEMLATANAPVGWSGVQAEVYFSRHRPINLTLEEVAQRVYLELCEIGVVNPELFQNGVQAVVKTTYVPWANVIFRPDTAGALETIWNWLEKFGLRRESGDTHPLTNWDTTLNAELQLPSGTLAMAGRFGQWKYYWSDDCVLRGKQIAQWHSGSGSDEAS